MSMYNLNPYKPRISVGLFILISIAASLMVDTATPQMVKPFTINIFAFVVSFLIQVYTVRLYEFRESKREEVNRLARVIDQAVIGSLIFIVFIGITALLRFDSFVVYLVGVYGLYNLFTLIHLAILNHKVVKKEDIL